MGLQEMAQTKGITQKDAIKQVVENNLETMKKAEDKFKTLEERHKRKHQSTC